MENLFERKKKLYRLLAYILIEIPTGLIGLGLIWMVLLGAVYAAFSEMAAWGMIPPLAHIAFVSGGVALMMASSLLRRMFFTCVLLSLGVITIGLGLQLGILSGSTMDGTFDWASSGSLIFIIGVALGICLSLGLKILTGTLDTAKKEMDWILAQGLPRLLLQLTIPMLTAALVVGLTFRGTQYGLDYTILAALASALAFGGVTLLHCLLARAVIGKLPTNPSSPQASAL